MDGPFDPARAEIYQRILPALDPDVIGFQEIYDHSAVETEALIESILPSSGSEVWHSMKVDPDIVAVSRYLILEAFDVLGNGLFLLDLSPQYQSQLLLAVCHFPALSDSTRQVEIDAVMAFIRDAKEPGGTLILEENTPILMMGDMNLTSSVQQLETLLTGQIVDQIHFGPAFVPDWDDTDFRDLLPRHIQYAMYYTRYAAMVGADRPDFMIYSDSVLEIGTNFVLFTPEMPPDTLAAYNLRPQDVLQASDHLPLTCDFAVLPDTSTVSKPVNHPENYSLSLEAYPNPTNPSLVARCRLQVASHIQLGVYDITGRLVALLASEYLLPGSHQFVWDAKEAVSGVYFLHLESDLGGKVKKVVVLR
jgi:hypothetical protein